MSKAIPPLDVEGERLWHEVTAVFADPARHDRFIHHCSRSGALPAAARRYRDWREAHGDDPTAAKMIQRITFLATQPLSEPKRPAPRRLGRGVLLAIIVVAAVAGALFGVLSGRSGR